MFQYVLPMLLLLCLGAISSPIAQWPASMWRRGKSSGRSTLHRTAVFLASEMADNAFFVSIAIPAHNIRLKFEGIRGFMLGMLIRSA